MKTFTTTIGSAVLAVAFAVTWCCGDDGEPGGDAANAAAAPVDVSGPSFTGSLIYGAYAQAGHYDFATRTETVTPLTAASTIMLGYGGGRIVQVDNIGPSAIKGPYVVNVMKLEGQRLARVVALPQFTVSNGHLSGPVQPSPDGKLFVMHTIESAGLSEPQLDHVYVFDAALTTRAKWVNLRDPIWVANDRLVMAADDGLFTVAPSAPTQGQRIGKVGLADPGKRPSRPAVSPDGRTLAFEQGDAIWTLGVDGADLTRRITAHTGMSWPTWSPSGEQLVVVRRSCPPLGAASADPELIVVSATRVDQDPATAPLLTKSDTVYVRSCGPVYWLP